MAQYGNSKNPPWARSAGMSGNQMQQSVMSNNMAGNQQQNPAMLQYPQQQMFQGQIAFQPQVYPGSVSCGNVSYPTRALNTSVFHSNTAPNTVPNNAANSNNQSNQNKQRVFTGTISKLQDNFGFVDENIFFQTSCFVKGSNPQVGDRVLVEAVFNSSMPFKWNATRIQVLNIRPGNNQQNQQNRGYNAVPPPSDNKMDVDGGGGGNRFSGGGSRFSGGRGGGGIGKQNDRRNMNRRRDNSADMDRKRPRKDKMMDRKGSPLRGDKKSKSPMRATKRRRIVPRYNVQVPKVALECHENDILDLKRKYTNMYIPSDFFMSKSKWISSFPLEKPFTLDFACKFHILHRDVEQPDSSKAVPEPNDVDYLFSSKVILMSSPGLDELYKRCIALADNRDRDESIDDEDLIQPARLVHFLVGQRGKEPLAIGGPWSPSLDGDDPESDPGVLIKTAIRTCRALTGIDLSNCTHWYRFLEMYYHRAESVHKGKTVPARVETVVLFIPDVWSCLPTRAEWDSLQESYNSQMLRKLNKEQHEEKIEDLEEVLTESEVVSTKRQPTHYSELDPKTMKVSDLRDELEVRSLSPKGLKSQLVARLSKALKSEADEEEKQIDGVPLTEDKAKEKKDAPTEEDKEAKKELKKEEEEKKKIDEREKALLEKRYRLPESPQILVHPNRNAKSGKFDCSVMSLFSLLSYRIEDNKEHSFEIFLFAEMFNTMMMRDFGFHIYRAIHVAPEKKDDKEKEEKEKKKLREKEEKDKEAKESKDKETKDSDEVEEIEDDTSETDKKDEKKEERKDEKKEEEKKKVKVSTVDPFLLLSFSFFDTTRCGYIFDKDLEELLSCLGLSLSRSQIKKLIQKVVVRDSLHYRKLTDKSKDEVEECKQDIQDVKVILSQSNKELLPMFDEDGSKSSGNKLEKLDSGFVVHNGVLVDVAKLLHQLERNEVSRHTTSKLYSDLLHEHNILKENYQDSLKNVKELTSSVSHYKMRLSSANSDLDMMDAKMMRYLDVFNHVRNSIDPILKENESDDMDVEPVANEKFESKPAEKETKPEVVKEEPKEVEPKQTAEQENEDSKTEEEKMDEESEVSSENKEEEAVNKEEDTKKEGDAEEVEEEEVKPEVKEKKKPVEELKTETPVKRGTPRKAAQKKK